MLASFQGSMNSYLKKANNIPGQSCGHRTPGWQVLVLPCKLPCRLSERASARLAGLVLTHFCLRDLYFQKVTGPFLVQGLMLFSRLKGLIFAQLAAASLQLSTSDITFSEGLLDHTVDYLLYCPLPQAPLFAIFIFFEAHLSTCNYFLYLLILFPTRIHVPNQQGLCVSCILTVFQYQDECQECGKYFKKADGMKVVVNIIPLPTLGY